MCENHPKAWFRIKTEKVDRAISDLLRYFNHERKQREGAGNECSCKATRQPDANRKL